LVSLPIAIERGRTRADLNPGPCLQAFDRKDLILMR
jgi:hypothetical protein